jgi:hypothetical protein
MKAALFIVAMMLALSGCSDTPQIKDKPDELAKLPQWTQVALVLETPICIFGMAAVIWAMNGVSLVKLGSSRSKEKSP